MDKKQKLGMASLACLILAFFGCQKSSENIQESLDKGVVNQRAQRRSSADFEKEEADKESAANENAANQEQMAANEEQAAEDDCDPKQKNKDDQCVLVPVDSCLGCLSADGGQKA